MKRFAMALLLACALSSVALAGDVPSTGNPAPIPVPGDMATPGAPAPGDMGNGGLALLILDMLF